MKDQYVGDINDYRKYAILRVLAGSGDVRVGTCWMKTPPDSRTDGSKTEYLSDPVRWRGFDPPLFDSLTSLLGAPDQRRLCLVEASGVIPGAVYCNAVVPIGAEPRRAYFAGAMKTLAGCDLIFFDPDNGLDVPSIGVNRRDAMKFVYRHELADAYQAGHSLLVYQHFARVERTAFVRRIGADLRLIAPDARLWVFHTAYVAFFLMMRPEHAGLLEPRITESAARWGDKFVRLEQLEPGAAMQPVGTISPHPILAEPAPMQHAPS